MWSQLRRGTAPTLGALPWRQRVCAAKPRSLVLVRCLQRVGRPSQTEHCLLVPAGQLQLQQRGQLQQRSWPSRCCSSDSKSGSGSGSGSTQHSSSSSDFTDMTTDGWLRWLPASALPYAQLARLDRPIGTWLLLWPCLWSISLATPAGALPDLGICALFSAGAVLMRGAGCTVNDLWDRDLDKHVERTRDRPLASGALSVRQALGFLSLQLSLALGVLVSLPPPAVACGLLATPLWAFYPLAKRYTDWPQLVLGLAINWGALLGWVAVNGTNIDSSVVAPLYAASVLWTLHYDTVYAHQDKRDDVRAGVRSTALRLGEHNGIFLSSCCVGAVGSLALSGAAAGLGPAYFAGIGGSGAHLAWQLRHLELGKRESCLAVFRSNRDFGAIVWLAIVAGKYLQEG